MPTQVYNCPIIDCAWKHRDDGPASAFDDLTPDEVNARIILHQATVEHTLRAHYESHDAEQWVTLVAKLQRELAGRPVPLVCVGCLSDRYQARTADTPLPPLNPAQTVVDGNAMCLGHVQFGQPEPQLPGRTRAGLIVGGT